ncbi:MAG: HAMP domain-containing sensor histidine kinase [Aggregatilineales bacterium]
MSTIDNYEQLLEELADLKARLDEAEETLQAIHSGEVDAFIVSTIQGNQVYTLQSADHPYRLLVEEMQQGAATIASDGTILYCNRRFAEILDYPSDYLISRPIDQHIVSSEREQFGVFLHTAAFQSNTYREFNYQTRTNQVIPVHIVTNLLQLDQTQVICLIVTDLRQRKQAEQQAIDLGIERQRTKLLTDFVRDTSHDLRTPITIILSTLSSIEYVRDEERRQEKLHQAESYVLYLNRVLEQLQQMAVLDSIRELPLHRSNINDVIWDAVQYVQKKADDKRITISTELESDNMVVRFDIDTLFSALTELIENAIRCSPQGEQIQVRSMLANDHQLLLEVTDHGSGIDPEILPHVFERFFKADKARGLTGGGGIGLSIVKRIVELHHGSIEVESIPGTATTFRIMLPIIVSDDKITSKS